MTGPATARRDIVVLAGTNGGGKSSVAGAALERAGGKFYNPDRATRAYLERGISLPEANSRAWRRGVRQLERAIRDGTPYAFETTLGGRTITRTLLDAAAQGRSVRIWYVGLASPELHIERVRARVAAGGHDIPEEKIRKRWDSSRRNLIRLLPHVRELVLFDNSRDVDLSAGEAPRPEKLLHTRDGRIKYVAKPRTIPAWAKSIIQAALSA
ncbi:MAG: AAA family ATPase [Dehalococcoidia bacterium]